MTESNSSHSGATLKIHKPNKPSPDFPLYAHPRGQWAKSINGKKEYFGSWRDDWDGRQALARYEKWLAKQQQLEASGAHDLNECCNHFLQHKHREITGKEKLSVRQYRDLEKTCQMLREFFGADKFPESITPLDWNAYRNMLDQRYGVHRYNNEITRTRQVFKWCAEYELCQRINFGPDFRRVRAKEMRAQDALNRTEVFTVDEINLLIEKSDPMLRAAVLLGINGGYNNADIAWIPKGIDYSDGWLDFARAKSHIPRLTPLWPETVEALDEYDEMRPKPAKDGAKDKFFLTRLGNDWAEDTGGSRLTNKLDQKMLRLGIKRSRLSFRSLRKTFSNIAYNAPIVNGSDAVKFLLGHADSSMLRHYVDGKQIDRSRLVTVTDYVREQLLDTEEERTLNIVG